MVSASSLVEALGLLAREKCHTSLQLSKLIGYNADRSQQSKFLRDNKEQNHGQQRRARSREEKAEEEGR